MAVSSLGRDGSVLLGPTIGGVLIQVVGVGWCYAVDVAGLVVGGRAVRDDASLPGDRQVHPAEPVGHLGWPSLRRWPSRPDGDLLVDIVAMVMAMPIVLFPALALRGVPHPRACSACCTRPRASAALIITATSGWTSRVHHHGRAVVLSAMCGAARSAWSGSRPTSGGRSSRSSWLGPATWSAGCSGHDLEPDDPGLDARAAGRHRDAVLLPGPARRPGPVGSRRRCLERARRDRQWRLLCVGGVALTAAWLRGFWSTTRGPTSTPSASACSPSRRGDPSPRGPAEVRRWRQQMTMRRHDYRSTDDYLAMQAVTQRTWTPHARWHVGDLAWGRHSMAGADAGWRTSLWTDGDQVQAWGWLELPADLSMVVDHPTRRRGRGGRLVRGECERHGSDLHGAGTETAITEALRSGRLRAGSCRDLLPPPPDAPREPLRAEAAGWLPPAPCRAG